MIKAGSGSADGQGSGLDSGPTEDWTIFSPKLAAWLSTGPFRGGARYVPNLPSRIILTVFGAALVTSFAVAWTSARSLESTLRRTIDQTFPALLRTASGQLDLWYSQAEHDIETFARSQILTANIDLLLGTHEPGESTRGRQALRDYLSYVLEESPRYEALFVLDRDGSLLMWVGGGTELSPERRRALAQVSDSRIGAFERQGPARFQILSAPALRPDGVAVGSLHAMIRLETVAAVLNDDQLGTAGRLVLIDADSHYVWGEGPRRYRRPLPAPDAESPVEIYEDGRGTLLLGSAASFPRFGWTVAIEQEYDEAFAPVVSNVRKILAINVAVVLICGLVALQLARSIVRPIRALSAAARWIADGESEVELPRSVARDEIGVLTRAFIEMTSRLRLKNDELQRMNEVLAQLSITDELTRLHNHRFFHDHLRRETKRALRTDQPLTLVLLDIDDFKSLNDHYGHAAGDTVLRQVAEVMNREIRETDLLARYGGEEFALLASQTPLEGAVALAEKIRMAISAAEITMTDEHGSTQVQITVSVGVAPFRNDEKAFFNDADRALYRAKASGKDCVVVDGEV